MTDPFNGLIGGPPEPLWYREVLGHYPTGVAVVTALDPAGDTVAMVVGSFVSVSLDPPLVAYFPQKNSGTYARLKDITRFAISVLAADQEAICRQLASRDPNKLEGVAMGSTASGTPVLEGAVAWLECDVEQQHEGGDHEIVVGRVLQMARPNPRLPLLFFQGGYGRFSPLSFVVPTEKDLIPSLRAVEAARSAMERLAADTGHVVLASAVSAGELVLLASAGGSEDDPATSLVGRRMPHRPPLGALFAATDDSMATGWLDRIPDGSARDAFSTVIDRVRERGWAVATADSWDDEWDSLLKEFSDGPYTPYVARRVNEVLSDRAGSYEPADGLGVGVLRLIAAPVRNRDGRVVLELLLLDVDAETDTPTREALLVALLDAAESASSSVSAQG